MKPLTQLVCAACQKIIAEEELGCSWMWNYEGKGLSNLSKNFSPKYLQTVKSEIKYVF